MKRVLLIFYDLDEPGKNREALVKKIKQYERWARLGSSGYLIWTDQTPSVVRDNLVAVLGPEDRVFVGVSNAPAAWHGMPEEVSKWILANQG
ncbi:MAG: hypothetical protein ABSB82_16770 [Terriglobia bacterium]|jgi:hypothetical protein